jgi:glycerol-3-phosphate dehydrogenase
VNPRPAILDRIRTERSFDVVIIGGGATGLGSGVDAASRGYSTLVLEAGDFARSTSSRSTKLIHGGVRYLAQGNLPLVREALAERVTLLRNAPHVVHRLDFLVPGRSLFELAYYAAGLKVYDALAGSAGLGGARWVGRKQALDRAPSLATGSLAGGVVYADGQFDDARMALALMRTVEDLGAIALNHARVIEIRKEGSHVAGVIFEDVETGQRLAVGCKALINAAGVEVDAVRSLDDPLARPTLAPSRGTHLVLDGSFLPGRTGVMIPKTDDGRVLFAIPWQGRVLLGTTDTPVDRVEPEPTGSRAEVDYLLDHAARWFEPKPRLEDVRSVYAGLRPLVAKTASGPTSALSREHALLVSESGLVTITGGKWTTYRRMARDAVDRAIEVAGLPRVISTTQSLHLHGWVAEPGSGPLAGYGSDASGLEALARDDPAGLALIHPDLPARRVEVTWAARHEQARTVEDVLARRTRGLFLDARAASASAPVVAALLARELGHAREWELRQVADFQALAATYWPG